MVFAAGGQCVHLASGAEVCQMLKIFQYCSKHCSCYHQGECVLEGVQETIYRPGRWQVECKGCDWQTGALCSPVGSRHVVEDRWC